MSDQPAAQLSEEELQYQQYQQKLQAARESQPQKTSGCEPRLMSLPLEPSGKCKSCGKATDDPTLRWNCRSCEDKSEAYWSEHRERERRESTERQMRRSGLPTSYAIGVRHATDADRSEIVALCELLGSDEVAGLLLFGPSKTFKTTIAAGWLAQHIRAGGVGRFVDVTDLMTDIQRSYRDDDFDSRGEIVDRLALTPALVLDDLGQEKASHHAGEVLRQILDKRRRNWTTGHWLIVTSNFTPEELRDRFEEPQTGNAILHRIAQLTIAVPMGMTA